MGGFLLAPRLSQETLADTRRRHDAALGVLARRGTPLAAEVELGSHALFLFRKQQVDELNLLALPGGDMIAAVGTLFYKRQARVDALAALYADFTAEGGIWRHLQGCFCVILRKAGEVFLFNDHGGIYHVFRGRTEQVISSSFLAVVRSEPTCTPAPQEVFEYMAQGGTFGDQTYVAEVEDLNPLFAYRISPPAGTVRKTLPAPAVVPGATVPALVDNLVDCFDPIFRMLADHFGDAVGSGLTGGYDTRLMVAFLKRAGVRPHLYVYRGTPDGVAGLLGLSTNRRDSDCAAIIAQGEGWELETFDKDAHPVPSLGDFPRIVNQRLLFLDGWGFSGAIDKGADIWTRLKRTEHSRVILHGGGGAMLRDSWSLPPWPIRLDHLVRGCIAAQNTDLAWSVFTRRFDRQQYVETLGRKLADALSLSSDRITRQEVERLRPRFTNRNALHDTAANNTLSYAWGPFTDPEVSAFTEQIPWNLKGGLQRALLQRIDPRLAAYPSSYGFAFDGSPPRRAKILSSLIRTTPVRLRHPMLTAIHRSRATATRMPAYLAPPYLETIVEDLRSTRVGEFVDLGRIRYPRLLSRALTLELVFRGRF